MVISIYSTVQSESSTTTYIADEHVDVDDDDDDHDDGDEEEQEQDDGDRYNDCCPFPFVVTTAMTNEYVACTCLRLHKEMQQVQLHTERRIYYIDSLPWSLVSASCVGFGKLQL